MVEQKQALPGNAELPAGDAERLSQVRDLLFGEHARSTDDRFTLLQSELERTRELLRGELGALRAGLTDELSTLRRALGAERDERGAGERRAQASLDEAREALEKSIAGAEEQTQAKLDILSGELERERRELREELDGLTHRKLDRATLAAFLTEFAQRVTDSEEG